MKLIMEKAKAPENIDLQQSADELIASALEGLRNDPLVYPKIRELGLTVKEVKANLSLLLSYQEDVHVCEKCPGLDSCPKSNEHLTFELGFGDSGELIRVISKCKPYLKKQEIASRYLRRDFPVEWIGGNLGNADRSNARNDLLMTLVGLISGDKKGWVYLTGSHRIGKSYLLACFANDYATIRKVTVAFADVPSLFEDLKGKSINRKNDFAREFESYQNVPLLVLDNFGNEYATQYTFSTIIYPLLLTRSQKGLTTAFTSDFNIDEVSSFYQKAVGPAREKQFRNLLRDNCKTFHLDGVSLY